MGNCVPKKTTQSFGVCGICHKTKKEADKLVILFPCTHIFHLDCMMYEVVQQKCRQCPSCASDICSRGGIGAISTSEAMTMMQNHANAEHLPKQKKVLTL